MRTPAEIVIDGLHKAHNDSINLSEAIHQIGRDVLSLTRDLPKPGSNLDDAQLSEIERKLTTINCQCECLAKLTICTANEFDDMAHDLYEHNEKIADLAGTIAGALAKTKQAGKSAEGCIEFCKQQIAAYATNDIG